MSAMAFAPLPRSSLHLCGGAEVTHYDDQLSKLQLQSKLHLRVGVRRFAFWISLFSFVIIWWSVSEIKELILQLCYDGCCSPPGRHIPNSGLVWKAREDKIFCLCGERNVFVHNAVTACFPDVRT